jgi:8-oxo-dGTP pyrophosphatase MutT (NUDIX family)
MKTKEDKKHQGWEIFPKKIIAQTPIVTISAGPVLCERTGRKKDFYLFDFPDWVNVVAITPAKDIVLVHQFRYGSDKVEIEIPGGMFNHGENPVEAGCRELLEETGYAGKNARIIGKVCPNPAIQRNQCYTILVEDAVNITEPRMDDMEDIECSLKSKEDILQYIAAGDINHGLVLNAFLFYFGLKN